MLHDHLTWLWFAVAALMLVDAVAYTFGAIGPIRRALAPEEPYWQKRLLLNLMLANQGLYLGAAMPLVGAVIEGRQPGTASALFALTLATCIYTLVTVPLLTPRDSGHAIRSCATCGHGGVHRLTNSTNFRRLKVAQTRPKRGTSLVGQTGSSGCYCQVATSW